MPPSTEFPPTALWPAIYEIATGREWPPRTSTDADALIEEAKRQFLLPLLFAAPDMPEIVRQRLASSRALERLNAARVAIFDRELAHIREILEGEELVLLKGFDYARRLYPDRHLRPMGDLDLFVPRNRVPEVRRRLLGAGMKQVWVAGPASRLEEHHEHVFTGKRLMVEVHHSFIQPGRHTVDYEGVWRRRVAFPNLPNVFRLGDADAIAYHALSMATDEFSVRFIRWLDLLLLLRIAPEGLPEAVERAHEWKSVRALYGAMRLGARVFPEMASPVAERLLSRPVRALLDQCVLPDPLRERGGHETGRARQLWRKFWLMDDVGQRIRFAGYATYAAVAGRLTRKHVGR